MSCRGRCASEPTELTPLEIECWNCFGLGKEVDCKHCDDGYQKVTACPQKLIGRKLSSEISLVQHAMNGLLPESGGLLDQDARFMALWKRFRSEVSYIDSEKEKS